MELKNGNISILVSDEKTRIEIMDGDSNTVFTRVELTPKQLSVCLSRQMHVGCKIVVNGIDRIGKTMIHKRHEFEIPDGMEYGKRTEVLTELIKKTLPTEWISDNYFGSQDTFFKRDGKSYAQTTIGQWI